MARMKVCIDPGHGAALAVCATCLQRRKRTGDCRIGHKTRPEPCREYLLDRRKKRGQGGSTTTTPKVAEWRT